MPTARFLAPALLVALLAPALAGCVDAPDPAAGVGDLPDLEEIAIPLVDMAHDHADPALHAALAHGIDVLGHIQVAGDTRGAARMVLADDLLVVSTTGGRVGLSLVDVSDAAEPVLLGRYVSEYGSSEGESIAVTTDGAYAFLGIETGYSSPAVPPAIEIVDVRDRANPKLAARIPVAAQPHVMTFLQAGYEEYLVVSDYLPTTATAGILLGSSAVNSGFTVYEFRRDAPAVVPLKRHTFDPAESVEQPFFTHDPFILHEHPVTGQRLLYLAAFGGGGRIYDMADPANPREIGVAKDKGTAPVLRHHSFIPAPVLVDDDILPTAAIPRSRAADGAAHLTFYDTADPTSPTLLGEWRHPDEDLIPGDDPPLNLHVPVFAHGGTRLLLPHFHAGLLVFDVSTAQALAEPRVVAYWTPGAESAPTHGASVAIVFMAIEKDGVILATDASTGNLHALRLAGLE